MYLKIIKPIVDFTLALVCLILLSPLFLFIMLSLFLFNQRQIFFVQERIGYRQKSFRIIKFKTMRDAKDSNGNLLPDELRLTNLGKFLRKTSLDELPQLINILKGEMSWVGPRPLLPEYLPFYSLSQRIRHQVKPGITGWAQVNGRNNISWKEKFELDSWYVSHCSFWLDLKIIAITLFQMLQNTNSGIIPEKFDGSN